MKTYVVEWKNKYGSVFQKLIKGYSRLEARAEVAEILAMRGIEGEVLGAWEL